MAKPKGTAVINYDEELARQAETAAAMEASTASGNFFSIKSATLMYNDAPMPGNKMGVIILGGILENVYYDTKYDPNDPTPPACYAFGTDDKTMAPHEQVVALGTAQNADCRTCEHNQFGSAETGRGKACGNRRRLALVAGGTIDQNSGKFSPFPLEDIEAGELAFLKVPPMSLKGYAAFVKQLSGVLRKPPHAVFTKVSVVPDPKSQFRILFEPLGELPNAMIPMVMKRHEEAMALIDAPYPAPEEDSAPAKPARGQARSARGAAPQAKAGKQPGRR